MGGRKGFAAVLEYDSTGAGAWVVIANLTKIRPFALKADVIDVTSMESAAETREKLPGLIDSGDCAFDVNWDPAVAASHVWFKANIGVVTPFRITLPAVSPAAAKKATFTGFVQSVPPEIPHDNKMTCSPVIAISGAISVFA